VRLRTAIGLIKNTSLQRHYADAIAAMRRELFRPREVIRADAGPRAGGAFAEAPVAPLAATRALAGQLSGENLRLALILATLCRYPTSSTRSRIGSNGWNRPTPTSPRWRCSSSARHSGTAPRCAMKSLKMATFPPLKGLRRLAICGSRHSCRMSGRRYRRRPGPA
jgi:hypothetical protein